MMIDFLAAGADASAPSWMQFLPIVGMVAIFWFLIIRPQMKKQKEHAAKIESVSKGNQIVTAGGIIGKVVKVDDDYAEIEIAQGVRVKVVKTTISDIVPKGTKPAAND